MRATHAIPGAKATPPGCNSPAFKGVTITWTLSPRRGLVLHSKIWVWNGPSLTFSFMKTGLSISRPDTDSGAAAPSVGPFLAAPEFTTAVSPCLTSRRLSPSPMRWTSCPTHFPLSHYFPPKHAGPYHEGNVPGKLGFIWDYQENDVFVIPGDHEAKRLSPCATQSNHIERVIHKVPQRQYRKLMLVHISRHHCVHLTATVCQGIDLVPLNLETHQSQDQSNVQLAHQQKVKRHGT